MISQPRSTIRIAGLNRLVEEAMSQERIAIRDGNYSIDSLVDVLKDGWLPFYECHKCGWFESCPHPRRVAANSSRARDIQCPVAIAAMRSFLNAWWDDFANMTADHRQHLFDALFFYVQFIFDTHIDTGKLIGGLSPEWWGPELAKGLTTCILYSRANLNAFAYHMSFVSPHARRVSIVLVEGEAEQVFLKRLCELRFFFSISSVESIGGKGNAAKTAMSAWLMRRQGHVVSIQIDGDSSKKGRHKYLVEEVQKHGGSVFIFKRDFESAFPPSVLSIALRALRIRVDESWLCERMASLQSTPILASVCQKYGVSINKPDLARILAELTCERWRPGRGGEFKGSEIAAWLETLW